jgi:4-hydroxymandelate oxidase
MIYMSSAARRAVGVAAEWTLACCAGLRAAARHDGPGHARKSPVASQFVVQVAAGDANQGDHALLSVRDSERDASLAMPPGVRDFVAGGSGAELTLAANRAALDSVFLVPRVLRGVVSGDPATGLVGCPSAMPVAVAPMAYQRMVHPDGEVAMARAAKEAGIPIAVSTLSSCSIEEIAAVGAVTWLQLYWLRDRAPMMDLIRRAEQAGCGALMLTVDVPRMGRRLRDLRNGFSLPPGVTAVNLGGDPAGLTRKGAVGSSGPAEHTAAVFDPTLSWQDVAWLQEQTGLPLVLKGILDPDDARRAADLGVTALVVSNHGGRQLDGALASATALPAVREAVAGRCEVMLDSGVRGGTDVLRALALGASGVLLGRPALWGLACGGARGAAQVLALLREELVDAMTLAGCPDVASAGLLHTVTSPGRPGAGPVS